jgi:hypothetical protein
MRHTLTGLALAALLVLPTTAHAAWHIGPNFGLTHASPEEGDGLSSVTWGGGSNILGIWQPGMRVGWNFAGPANELYTASGFEILSGSSSSFHVFQLSLNYQRNLSPAAANGSFVTGGIGFMSIGGEGESATVPVIGVGVGFMHTLTNGHGRMRGEVRFDHQSEDSDFGLSSLNIIGMRLGFDLLN